MLIPANPKAAYLQRITYYSCEDDPSSGAVVRSAMSIHKIFGYIKYSVRAQSSTSAFGANELVQSGLRIIPCFGESPNLDP